MFGSGNYSGSHLTGAHPENVNLAFLQRTMIFKREKEIISHIIYI